MIEFSGISRQHQLMLPRLLDRINSILQAGTFILGPEVKELEEQLAQRIQRNHCISCANGTDALHLVLMALGIGKGDLVFVPAFTFIATAEVVKLVGAVPWPLDICPTTFNISAESLLDGISSAKIQEPELRQRAVIAVSLFGLPAPFDDINKVARDNQLLVIEDAAQSFGAKDRQKHSGNLCEIATTSFFPSKPLGAYGDGGAIFCDQKELCEKLTSLRMHGIGSQKYNSCHLGMNSRLDTLQAGILLEKLVLFDEELKLRQRKALNYSKLLNSKFSAPKTFPNIQSAWAQYTIIVEAEMRDLIISHLLTKGIPTVVYYPFPIHKQDLFLQEKRYADISLPICEDLCKKVLSLPFHPYLKDEEQEFIVESLFEVSTA